MAGGRLVRLRSHIAVVWDASLNEPNRPAKILLFDGKRFVREQPGELPAHAAGWLSLAGDWPESLAVVAYRRAAIGIGGVVLPAVGFTHTSAGWEAKTLQGFVTMVGDRTLTLESVRERGHPNPFRVVQGPPLPQWVAAAASPSCPADLRSGFALHPVALASWGTTGLAALGTTCDRRVVVERFPEGGGPGGLDVLPVKAAALGAAFEFEGGQLEARLLSRDVELWVVSYGAVSHFDGSRWRVESLPNATPSISGAAVADDGSLWLCDGGRLLQRTSETNYVERRLRPADGEALEIEPMPGGGLALLTTKGLYRL